MFDRSAAPVLPRPGVACIYLPPAPGRFDAATLRTIAQDCSPRYECCRDDLVVMDITGLERLMRAETLRRMRAARGPDVPDIKDPGRGDTGEAIGRPGEPALVAAWRTVGSELVHACQAQGARAHVAVAATRVAALVLAHARPGLTVIAPGAEASALSSVPLDVLARVADTVITPKGKPKGPEAAGVTIFKQWALRTLGDLAALPAPDLVARIGRQALVWQAIARGEDLRPLVPTEPDERFEETLELEWPIDGLEPLSFVLTRLLEPLCIRLERRDRGAARLHVVLDLVTREVHARQLQLPSPLRDVRALRTLALLDLESHPPSGAIDRVRVVVDPTPGRIVQHTLFTRAQPAPERMATLLARLGAVMGHDRIGAPMVADTYQPGAFAVQPFAIDHTELPDRNRTRLPETCREVVSALRRCRHPVPARVVIDQGCPMRVTSDRRGFAGGAVTAASGPWRTSGNWWEGETGAGRAGMVGRAGREDEAGQVVREAGKEMHGTGETGSSSCPPCLPRLPCPPSVPWDRDEWDVALADGARYRVFRDRVREAWFIEGIFD